MDKPFQITCFGYGIYNDAHTLQFPPDIMKYSINQAHSRSPSSYTYVELGRSPPRRRYTYHVAQPIFPAWRSTVQLRTKDWGFFSFFFFCLPTNSCPHHYLLPTFLIQQQQKRIFHFFFPHLSNEADHQIGAPHCPN